MRQLYFVVFEAPAFDRFRGHLARLYEMRGGSDSFDPGALRPVLPVAASVRDLARWWPLEVDAETDCRAPLAVESPPLRSGSRAY